MALVKLENLEKDCMKILCHICSNVDDKGIYKLKKMKRTEEDLPKYKQKLYYTENYNDIREGTRLAKSTIVVKCGIMKREGIIDILEDSEYINITPNEECFTFLESLKYRNKTKSDEEYLQVYRELDKDTWFYQEVLKIMLKNVNKYNLSWDTYSVFMDNAGMTYKEIAETIATLTKEGFIEKISRRTKIIYILKDWTVKILNEI